MKELPKAYEPATYEDGIYNAWEQSDFFNPDTCLKAKITHEDDKSFSIALPPPNVTGTLHMGHAAMLAIEDVLVRYHRMKGDRTLWVPGTDHAAVATESKVESLLIKNEGFKKPKTELGRDAFLDRVKEFAQASHDTIVNQSKKMGASLDWSREAYTFDETRNKAVRMVFKKMYDDGLIYRGYRVVNWSVKGQSTCSDDELEYVERPAKLYFFKYSEEFPITIATSRPETKLGDTAVAVNPHDKRYKQYIGKEYKVNFLGQPLSIKIVADDGVNPDFGTGALGVTPAHSMVDYEIANKNGLKMIRVISETGLVDIHDPENIHRENDFYIDSAVWELAAEAKRKFNGLTVTDARKAIVEELNKKGLIEKEEDIVQNVSTSDRFKDIVEPLPKVQWFVDVNKKFVLPHSNIIGVKDGQEVTLKELMQQVVTNKQIQILPERFEKTYFHWINNLRDWCISRQIWFGHQVPVWYRGEEMYCGVEAPEGEGWQQDSDTLDTWFSSGLWTFSTLLNKDFEKYSSLEDWLANSPDFKNFHPTSVLETGYDILFFWVARMILMTTYTLGTIPFKTVYLHGLVRDEQGRKMSKTLGNIIDPLDMIAKYGTDATRLSLLIGTAPGNDLKLSEEKIAGFRNFANKLWNISRFMLLKIDTPKADCLLPDSTGLTLADKALLYRLNKIIIDTAKNLEAFNISYAGEQLRDFTWRYLADRYLEEAKSEGEKSQIFNFVLNVVLKLWHPFMPFVTETIWKEMYGETEYLMVAKWPQNFGEEDLYYEEQGKFQNIVQDTYIFIRSFRSENRIEPAKKLNGQFVSGSLDQDLKNSLQIIIDQARLDSVNFVTKEEINASFKLVPLTINTEFYLDVGSAMDVEKEKVRLEKDLAEAEKYVTVLQNKLANQDFVARAPEAVIAGERAKLAAAEEKVSKTRATLESLLK